jgi:uncharacterized membrane protein (UPF0136 family)
MEEEITALTSANWRGKNGDKSGVLRICGAVAGGTAYSQFPDASIVAAHSCCGLVGCNRSCTRGELAKISAARKATTNPMATTGRGLMLGRNLRLACANASAEFHLGGWTPARACITSSGLEMLGPARIYFIIFGVLTIAGGIIGYVKAGSAASIIAGSVCGLLLLVGAFILPQHRTVGLVIGLIVSLLLAAQFIPKFFRTGKVMPAGAMALLSVLGIIVAIAAWVKE